MMLFKRNFSSDNSSVSVTAGSTFYRRHNDSLVETARVISVDKDSFGIQHVRFEVSFSRPSRNCFQDARVLALKSFSRHYPERLQA